MPLVPIDLPPGIAKNATEYSNKGRWTDGSLVRWVNGKMQPVGGWIKIADVPVTDPNTSPVRSLFSWEDNNGDAFTAMGTNDKLFAYYGTDPNDNVIDITPTDPIPLGAGSTPGYGYGSSTYGTGRYGVRIPAPAELAQHATWDFDNFGEDLLAVHSTDGHIWRWQRGVSPIVEAAVLPNAPLNNLSVIVTEERHVVALGAGGDPRRVDWSDRENPEEWTPTATNQAGGFTLQTTGNIVGAVHVRGGILILTTTDAHLMRFIGGQFVYKFDHVGHKCGVLTGSVLVDAFDVAIWMGTDRFWMYDGAVKPLQCDVLEHVFQRMNRQRPFAFAAGQNARYNEVWFYYPTSGDLNPTEYVLFSFRDQPHWSIGQLERTAWHDNQVYQAPIAMDEDGGFYIHEQGFLDDGNPRLGTIFAETAPIDIRQGEYNSRVRKFFQDAFDPDGATFPYQVELKMRPAADGGTRNAGPYSMDNQRGYTDVRAQGRSAQVRVINNQDAFWEFGVARLDVTKGGRRGL